MVPAPCQLIFTLNPAKTKMDLDPDLDLDLKELVEHLKSFDPDLVDALLDPDNYTSNDRVKVASIARRLDVSSTTVRNRLVALRETLG